MIFCWICLFVFIVETCKVMMGEINVTTMIEYNEYYFFKI